MSQLVTTRRRQAAVPAVEAQVAVLVPCYNEALSVAQVVEAFQAALPAAIIYVYDNNSKDDTARIAEAAGAVVRRETRQGKGHVVRRMFADIEADIYLMVDGDATYDAAAAPRMIAMLREGPYDLVNGARRETSLGAYRPGHRLGNRVLTGVVGWAFGSELKDMLSGYKVMSRRFVKSFPMISKGFEIETEILVHAHEMRAPLAEFESNYGERPEGSLSKLNTIRDGVKITRLILHLIKAERPLQFFSFIALVLAVVALSSGLPVVAEYLRTGLVPRLPTALLAASLMLAGALSLVTGLILDTVVAARREAKLLQYLRLQAPQTL